MASVTSFTATKIQDLLAGWEGIGLNQDEINALVIQLSTAVDEHGESLGYFNTVVRPQLEANLAANAVAVSDLNDNRLPALQADLDAAALSVQNLHEVDVPSLRTDLDNTIANVIERPKVYVQDEAPTNPDDDERDLVVGDTWFDSNDNNRQKIWNGVEWSTFNIDVADFSLTARSFFSTRHQIY